ncbi:glycosyltransferase [Thermoplasmatales archaeon SCGC AB-539-N05]|nr:glycosyltransferase [Thermoplasmatales archaeon SCGC AB-539-N05]
MRIAMICPHYGYIYRGTENTTYQVSKRLKYDVDIFGLGYKSNIIVSGLRKDRGLGKLSNSFAEKTMFGGLLRRYVGLTPHIEDISFNLKLKPILEKSINSYDLLWSNGEYWCAKTITKLGRKHRKSTLLFFGGGISKMMLDEALMLPDLFIVLTPEMEKWIRIKVTDCNVKCIPCGVDLDMFNSDEMGNPTSYKHPIVISTSALVRSKRIDLIIKAMYKLGKGTLLVTSDGPDRDRIVKLGEKLIGKRFIYLGKVKYKNLPSFYRQADVMILASENEPFGMVILEAMACNTPAIVQKDPTRKWMVNGGGLLLEDITDIDDLVGAIEQACATDWKDKPRKQAEKFSWDKTVEGYEKIIGEL